MINARFKSVVGVGFFVLDIIMVEGEDTPRYQAGGTCGNVICMLAYLGWKATLYGRVAPDWAGEILLSDFNRHKVNTTRIIEDLHETPSIIEKLDPITAKHSFKLRCPVCSRHLSSYRSLTLTQIENSEEQAFTCAGIFFFDRVSPANLSLAARARQNGSLVVFEPPRCAVDSSFLKAISLSHVVKYASTTMGKNLSDGLASICFEDDLPDLEIETLGSQGLRFRLNRDMSWNIISSVDAFSVVDTTGAGDWLTASFLDTLRSFEGRITENVKDCSIIHQSLSSAQKVAAYNCQYIGARGAMDLMSAELMIDSANRVEKPLVHTIKDALILNNGNIFSCKLCLNI